MDNRRGALTALRACFLPDAALQSPQTSHYGGNGGVPMNTSAIETYYANEFFGCSLSDMRSDRDTLCPHRHLKGYNGLFVMKLHGKFVLSAPEERVASLREIINHGRDLFDTALWRDVWGENLDRVIGPAWIGHHEGAKPRDPSESVVLLHKTDARWPLVFQELKPACDPIEWAHSGIDEASGPIAVLPRDGRFVSAASYALWGQRLAHIGIITHPGFRNQGFASDVLSALTGFLHGQDLIPQYRTLCANTPALRAAARCGYGEFATHISVRLR